MKSNLPREKIIFVQKFQNRKNVPELAVSTSQKRYRNKNMMTAINSKCNKTPVHKNLGHKLDEILEKKCRGGGGGVTHPLPVVG